MSAQGFCEAREGFGHLAMPQQWTPELQEAADNVVQGLSRPGRDLRAALEHARFLINTALTTGVMR